MQIEVIVAGVAVAVVLGPTAYYFLTLSSERQSASEAERRLMAISVPLYRALSTHDETLARRLAQLAWKDVYGNWVTTKWRKELDYFFDTNVRPHLHESVTPQELRQLREDLYWNYERNSDCLDPFWLDEWVEEEATSAHRTNDGLTFERQVGARLASAGYSVNFTPATGDQGVDLIAEKAGVRLAVQCKDYKGPVGNDAVQQVYAGGAFYKAARTVVVAPNGFTVAAKQLASSLGVECLHPNELGRLAGPNDARIASD